MDQLKAAGRAATPEHSAGALVNYFIRQRSK
jgi:hypothetical protein